MLTVCTSSTEVDYCTCGDVMDILFNSTSTAVLASTDELGRISRVIRRASQWAERYVQRPLLQQTYSETVPAYGRRELMLSRYPIVKVLRFFDATDTGSAGAICSTDFRVANAEAGLLDRDAGFDWTATKYLGETDFNLGLTAAYRPDSVAKPYLVEYVAGYSVVGTTSTAGGLSTADETWTTGPTLPADVVQAVAVKAADLYSNPQGIISRSVGDLNVWYAGRSGTFAKSEAETLLDAYRSEL